MNEINNSINIVCFGEVLWDIFPSGSVAGGAPMNVAYHLHQHYLNPTLITSVGDDAEGEKIKKYYKSLGINTDFFQTDKAYETGKVYVHLDANKTANYEIVHPVSWDHIRWSKEVEHLVKNAKYFVFGTLSSRSEQSKKTLQKLLKVAQTKILDMNLRSPYYSFEFLQDIVSQCNILKVNSEELDFFCQNVHTAYSIEEKANHVKRFYEVDLVIVTNGSKESYLFEGDNTFVSTKKKISLADTVGCGDAFLAGFLYKHLSGAPSQECLEYANSLGAFIATKTGACPKYNLNDLKAFVAEGK